MLFAIIQVIYDTISDLAKRIQKHDVIVVLFDSKGLPIC